MDIIFLLKGILLGLSIAAPVGPIGVLCIRRTLTDGFAWGFASGLGAATADSLYGMVAAFGLTSISYFLVGQQLWLRLIGGAFLCFLGIRTLLSKPASNTEARPNRRLAGAYLSALGLTITNPMTILSFAAIFVGLGLGGNSLTWDALILVLGVLLGSLLWWLFLCGLVSVFCSKIDIRGLGWINRLSGAIITGFGLYTLLSIAI